MRRFAFRLRRVQALRRQEADAARLTLAQAVNTLARCEQRLATIDQLAGDCQLESRSERTRPLADGLLRGLELARARALHTRSLAANQLVASRAAYLQRRSAAAAIDKLHAARRASWLTATAAEHQGELEELARLSRQASARRLVPESEEGQR